MIEKTYLKVKNTETWCTSILDVTFENLKNRAAITPLNGKGVIDFHIWLILFRDFILARYTEDIERELREEYRRSESFSEAFFKLGGNSSSFSTTWGVVKEYTLNKMLDVKKRETDVVHVTGGDNVCPTQKLIPLLKIWNHFHFYEIVEGVVGEQTFKNHKNQWEYPWFTVEEFVPKEFEWLEPQKFSCLNFLAKPKEEE